MNANKPAFPVTNTEATTGLTKLELFSAMAMQGIISGNHPAIKQAGGEKILAREAVVAARALIAELEKQA